MRDQGKREKDEVLGAMRMENQSDIKRKAERDGEVNFFNLFLSSCLLFFFSLLLRLFGAKPKCIADFFFVLYSSIDLTIEGQHPV